MLVRGVCRAGGEEGGNLYKMRRRVKIRTDLTGAMVRKDMGPQCLVLSKSKGKASASAGFIAVENGMREEQ